MDMSLIKLQEMVKDRECCGPRGRKELDKTEQLNNHNDLRCTGTLDPGPSLNMSVSSSLTGNVKMIIHISQDCCTGYMRKPASKPLIY